ncbi:type 2 lanthipeptide synthetase LanM family protein [Dactylosporangium sp. CA-092794]|uniref:type 2 lanthipeptide synthetase LanM family protein n=1 Tax=Dactylosporangium sp. CA-092794 TaxID=3239929 RepID=UPI003D8E666E
MSEAPVASPVPPTLPELAGPAWARALTLAERVAAAGLAAPDAGADPARARRRLERWEREHDLAERGAFEHRLADLARLAGPAAGPSAGAGAGRATLRALLGESAAHLAGRAGTPPAWAATLHEILATVPAAPPATDTAADWQAGMARIVAPFVHHAAHRLRHRLAADPAGIDPDALLPAVTGELSAALSHLAGRTLVLELNVLRLQGRLHGETPAERFWSFVEHFAGRAGREALFAEYPVLARLLVQRAEHTAEAVWEFSERWRRDRAEIAGALFDGAPPGPVTSIGLSAGDGHQRGRCVYIVELAGGRRVVYKPRPLAVHERFNELVRWFDRRAGGLGLRTLRVLDRGAYGWIEFAAHAPCERPEDVERYYRRLGALLALLYAVDGSDFHFENLVACGDQPVLIDLETLFHPRPAEAIGDPAQALLDSSVMRIGLLPTVMSTQDGAIDLGGIGGDQGAVLPYALPAWERAGTDAMHLVRKRPQLGGGRNRPVLDGAVADPARYAGPLLAGFRDGYRTIVAHRDELAGPAGPLAGFAGVEVRAVLRATRVYGAVLAEGTHPDVLRDALDLDRHLDFLWSVSADQDDLRRVVPHEIDDLWSGDIPLFTARPDTRDLWTSRGERIGEHFPAASLDRVRAKLAELGDADRDRQEWLIQASLATRPGTADVVPRPDPGTPLTPRAAAVPVDACVAAARDLGDRIAALAVRRGARASWLGLDLVGTRWRVNPLRWDLYSGYPGVALFLAQLAAITGEDRYARLCRDALWPLPDLVDRLAAMAPEQRRTVIDAGGFTGLAGLAYALTHVAAGTGEASWLALAERVLGLAPSTMDDDETLDVVGGSAGVIAAALAVHSGTGSARALELAGHAGRRLLERARPDGRGVAWPATVDVRRPLTGFSHGAAGAGWALIRLGAATGEGRYTETGLAAFAYEREQYRPEWENWPDFRRDPLRPDAELSHMFAWCHGAPGIGLARADALGVLDDPALHTDLGLALGGTLRHGFGTNHSLCHGDLGNAELLLAAREHTGGDQLDLALAEVAERVLASLAAQGPRCGTPQAIDSPGLLTGLAGIGHGLLRLACPDRVASVLRLQPPREAGRA